MSGRAVSLCLLAAIVVGLLLTVAMVRWADERQMSLVGPAAPIGDFVQAPGAEVLAAQRKAQALELERQKETNAELLLSIEKAAMQFGMMRRAWTFEEAWGEWQKGRSALLREGRDNGSTPSTSRP